MAWNNTKPRPPREPKRQEISADSWIGRVLLALRAGPLPSEVLAERWPTGHGMSLCLAKRLVEKVDGQYRITAAGLAACPLRNPAAAKAVPPLAGAICRRAAQDTPVSAVAVPLRAASINPTPTTLSLNQGRRPTPIPA